MARFNLERLAITVAFIVAGTTILHWAFTAHWKKFVSKEGAFTVLLPGKPETETRSQVINGIPVEMHSFSAWSPTKAEFVVTYADGPVALSAAGAEAMFDAQRQGLTQGDESRLLSDEKSTVNGYPARLFKVITESGSEADEKLYLVKRRLYILLAIHDKGGNENEVKLFFDSFTFEPRD